MATDRCPHCGQLLEIELPKPRPGKPLSLVDLFRGIEALWQHDALETSVEAGRGVQGTSQAIVVMYAHLRHPEGLTDEELDDVTGIRRGRTRRKSLEERKLIYRTNEKRPFRSGREGYVWKATDIAKVLIPNVE